MTIRELIEKLTELTERAQLSDRADVVVTLGDGGLLEALEISHVESLREEGVVMIVVHDGEGES